MLCVYLCDLSHLLFRWWIGTHHFLLFLQHCHCSPYSWRWCTDKHDRSPHLFIAVLVLSAGFQSWWCCFYCFLVPQSSSWRSLFLLIVSAIFIGRASGRHWEWRDSGINQSWSSLLSLPGDERTWCCLVRSWKSSRAQRSSVQGKFQRAQAYLRLKASPLLFR